MAVLYIFKNSYLLKDAKRKIKKDFSSRGFLVVEFNSDNFSQEDFFSEIRNISLFSSKKAFICEEVLPLISKDNLKKFGSSFSSGNIVFFEGKIDKEKSKYFSKIIESEDISKEKLNKTINDIFYKFNSNPDAGVVEYIAKNLKTDLWAIENLIKQVIAYKNEKYPKVKLEDIKIFLKENSDYNIFSTLKVLFLGNKKSALNLIMSHLSKGDDPLYLMSMVEYQLRTIIEYYDALDRRIMPNSYKYNNFSRVKISRNKAVQLYNELVFLDTKIKKGALDPQTALEKLVFDIISL